MIAFPVLMGRAADGIFWNRIYRNYVKLIIIYAAGIESGRIVPAERQIPNLKKSILDLWFRTIVL